MASSIVLSVPQSSVGDILATIIITKGSLPTAPGNWTLVAQTSSTGFAGGLWSHAAILAEPSSYTWGLSVPQPFTAATYDITGVSGTPKFGATLVGSGNTASAPSIPGAAAGLLVCAFAVLGNTEFSVPAGMDLVTFQQIEGFASAIFTKTILAGATGIQSSVLSISAAHAGIAMSVPGVSVSIVSSTSVTSP